MTKRGIRILSIVTAVSIGCVGGKAQETVPRGLEAKASVRDYEKFVEGERMSLGANYWGRGFEVAVVDNFGRTTRKLYGAGKYLVFEVGLHLKLGVTEKISIQNFSLAIDGKKMAWKPVTPGFVAGHLRYPDWEGPRKGLEMGGGLGGVVVGRPKVAPRFPGDPQRPASNSVSEEGARAAVESSLPEEEFKTAIGGNLYFDYGGKLAKVKSMVLLYESGKIRLELKLR